MVHLTREYSLWECGSQINEFSLEACNGPPFMAVCFFRLHVNLQFGG